MVPQSHHIFGLGDVILFVPSLPLFDERWQKHGSSSLFFVPKKVHRTFLPSSRPGHHRSWVFVQSGPPQLLWVQNPILPSSFLPGLNSVTFLATLTTNGRFDGAHKSSRPFTVLSMSLAANMNRPSSLILCASCLCLDFTCLCFAYSCKSKNPPSCERTHHLVACN